LLCFALFCFALLCSALQTKKRAKIRLKEGRAKPIDILAKNLQVTIVWSAL
jgi:hypothetical protein